MRYTRDTDATTTESHSDSSDPTIEIRSPYHQEYQDESYEYDYLYSIILREKKEFHGEQKWNKIRST